MFDGLVEVGVIVHGLLLLTVLGLVAQAVAAVGRGRRVRRVEAVARAVQGFGLPGEGGEG